MYIAVAEGSEAQTPGCHNVPDGEFHKEQLLVSGADSATRYRCASNA